MNFNFFKPRDSIFREFASKGFAEAIQLSLNALTVAITHSSPIGIIIGAGAKAVTEKLLDKSSEIDKKIDKLIREPLLSGIKHLHEGLLLQADDEESLGAKDQLLHQAHVSLIKAWSLMTESIEDGMFILALDSIALAAHSEYKVISKDTIQKLDFYLQDQRMKVQAICSEAEDAAKYEAGVKRFLYTDPWRDKPLGYGEQILAYKQIKKYTKKIEEKANKASASLNVLINLTNFSKKIQELSCGERVS